MRISSPDGMIRLHEHAHNNKLRVIIWNRRDYRGSTKYTDAELDDLKAGRKVFQDRLDSVGLLPRTLYQA
jgi:hypothetical protein